MEYDRKDLLTGQDSNKFINTKAKIRNKKLGNDSAWIESQPLLAYCAEDYPEKYQHHLSLIRNVFNLRRNSYLDQISDMEASKGVQELIGKLSEEEQKVVTGLIVCIRDLFNTPASWKGKTRLWNRPLNKGDSIRS